MSKKREGLKLVGSLLGITVGIPTLALIGECLMIEATTDHINDWCGFNNIPFIGIEHQIKQINTAEGYHAIGAKVVYTEPEIVYVDGKVEYRSSKGMLVVTDDGVKVMTLEPSEDSIVVYHTIHEIEKEPGHIEIEDGIYTDGETPVITDRTEIKILTKGTK